MHILTAVEERGMEKEPFEESRPLDDAGLHLGLIPRIILIVVVMFAGVIVALLAERGLPR